MTVDRFARNNPSPILVALRLALEEIAGRRAAERVDRRAKLTVVDGRRRDAA